MSILVCGSIAYDTIMVFHDQFKNHILPDQIHILNVAFLVPDLRREYGGCAGNIAYGLKLLGEEPLIMATVGHDFDPYERRLDLLGISRRHVRKLDEHFTAQAFITTDIDDNQITAFHPGAMSHSHANRIGEAERRAPRDRLPGRPAGHARARPRPRPREDPLRARSRPGAAHVLGRGPPRDARRRALPDGERLRGTPGRTEDRRSPSPNSPGGSRRWW